MIRLIGAVFIVAGTATVGVTSSLRLKRRVRNIGDYIDALAALRSEIRFRMGDTPEVLRTAADMSHGGAGRFLSLCAEGMTQLDQRPFREIWSRALFQRRDDLPDRETYSAVEALGGVLGGYGLEDVLAALDSASMKLSSFKKRAEAERDGKGRVCAAMGVASGLLAALIFI